MNKMQKANPQKKRTAPRDVRRKQLISAAIDSISRRGFSDTTLRHVTEKAQLSHGVVNYHFESKEALYDATLGYLAKEHYDTWTRYLQESIPKPAHQLVAIIEADFDKKICTHKKLAVWFAFWGQAKYRPNYLKIHNKYDDQRADEIYRICSKIVKEGGYTDVDARRTARTIESLTDGFWLSLMLYPAETNREESRSDCLHALTGMFPKHFPLADAAVADEPVLSP
ncbi:TetR family transcriptional regulator [Rhodobacteraceae bacterium R_SAG10]|nr:TetR family transcriptional regulator [Rhodobacteraceae bacterium R_SAG10]